MRASSRRTTLSARLLSAIVSAAILLCAGAVSATTVCRGAGHDRWVPYSYRLTEGTMEGAAHEALRLALRPAGMDYVAVDLGPWKRVIANLAGGTIDIVASASRTAERDAQFLFTDPFHEELIVAVVRADSALTVGNWDDLRLLRVAVVRGHSYGETWDRFARDNLNLVEPPSEPEAFMMMLADRVDVLITPKEATLRILRRTGRDTVFRVLPEPVVRRPIQAMIRRDSPCAAALDTINRNLRRMVGTGEIERLVARHQRDLDS